MQFLKFIFRFSRAFQEILNWVITALKYILHAGAIVSTANDMARWMNMLSGGLNETGEKVFSSDVILETWSPVNAHLSSHGYYPAE